MIRYPLSTVAKAVGILSITVSLVTWATDLLGIVDPCGYCRVSRSVIGILGALMLLPSASHWLLRYLATTIAALGVVVAGTQHFNAWNEISKGHFDFSAPLYANHYLHLLMSAGALMTIVAQILLIHGLAAQTFHPTMKSHA